MDGTEKLTQSTLADSLNAACEAMAEYMAWDSDTITENDIEALPDYVFNLAVAANWLPNLQILRIHGVRSRTKVTNTWAIIWFGQHIGNSS